MLRPFYLIVLGILGLNWVIADSCNAAETPVAGKEEEQATKEFVGLPIEGPGLWHTDYSRAKLKAKAERKMLFIYFYDEARTAARQAFEEQTLKDPKIQAKLDKFVLARVPTTAKITVDGKDITILRHSSFSEMLGRAGVAIIDYVNEKHLGYVVTTIPFTTGKYYRKEALNIVLDLPAGTLTQRTMIFAVRLHPEGPASTTGQFNPVLADEAKSHSSYQAAITSQGHHGWGSRFQRINSRLPSDVLAQEVVAESWPNEGLVDACVDCVDSWRQSPGHWGAVRSRHPLFGYDIKRGRNGIWYATGIFGRRGSW